MAEGANRHHHPYAPALEIIDYSGGHPDGNALRGGRVGSEIHQLHRIDEAQYHQIHRRMIRAIQIAVDQPPIICVKSRHVRHRSPAASVRIAMPSTVNLYRSLRVRANLEQNKSSENDPSYPSSHRFLLVIPASVPKKMPKGCPTLLALRKGGEFDFRDENSSRKEEVELWLWSPRRHPRHLPRKCQKR